MGNPFRGVVRHQIVFVEQEYEIISGFKSTREDKLFSIHFFRFSNKEVITKNFQALKIRL